MLELNQIYNLDCFDLLAQCDDQSVDAIIADLPYGTTACSWDSVIPLESMWTAFKRVIKPRGAVVLTASQPFTSALVMSNVEMFKYSWVWVKSMATGHMHAKNKPLKRHEDILVFSPGTTIHANQSALRMSYYPQMLEGEPYQKTHRSHGAKYLHAPSQVNLDFIGTTSINSGERYPNSVLEFDNGNHKTVHPTQKPLALMSYLVRTYTRPGELVLDPTCGSGTTALAARNEGRRYLAGDTDAGYCEIARKRLAAPYTPPLFPDDTPAEPIPAQTSFLE